MATWRRPNGVWPMSATRPRGTRASNTSRPLSGCGMPPGSPHDHASAGTITVAAPPVAGAAGACPATRADTAAERRAAPATTTTTRIDDIEAISLQNSGDPKAEIIPTALRGRVRCAPSCRPLHVRIAEERAVAEHAVGAVPLLVGRPVR